MPMPYRRSGQSKQKQTEKQRKHDNKLKCCLSFFVCFYSTAELHIGIPIGLDGLDALLPGDRFRPRDRLRTHDRHDSNGHKHDQCGNRNPFQGILAILVSENSL
jgi:hypothetical protein